MLTYYLNAFAHEYMQKQSITFLQQSRYLIIIIYILFSSTEVYKNGITYYNVITQLKIFLNNY